MIKILSSKQIKDWDAYTIAHEPISPIDLMERACRAFVTWFVQHVDATKKIGVVCGTGNNGGDGLGIARLLKDWGYQVEVMIVEGAAESNDFKTNLNRLKNILPITRTVDQNFFVNKHVVIDAIFGTGLSRPVAGNHLQAIHAINNSGLLCVAVDIPSGLSIDNHVTGEIVKADFTVTFQFPKLAFLLPGYFQYTGEWITVDIGLSKDFVKSIETSNYYITQKAVSKILKLRNKFDHKGVYGHALVVAGSYGKIGAAILSTKAALRAGAGLVTTHLPACGYYIIQGTVPEAMASVDVNHNVITDVPSLEKFSTIAIGPGLGTSDEIPGVLKKLFTRFRKPIVIDADALNVLATHRELMNMIPEGSILTPHPKEFERLVGRWMDDFERLEKQKELATELKVVVLLKGAFTSIGTPSGELFFNSTGNPGMATGGSGDVLTGILAGLLAQNYSPIDAAVLGVYLHGLAGDKAAIEKSMNGMVASDLIEFLPQAFLQVLSTKR